ncbi:AraC family transcriptional regulator [Chitinophaga alhagiae]|uniref:AraC family transcriptional regulator n=1 Tax=Chitinophaga alhagiae TaxID=2203219 RepID=UPI000E5A9316|nr:AraC family transcriptional regulator [Chitinophaga alhagiae]
MKAKLFSIPFSSESSFLYKKMERNCIDDPWHFHKEYELILVEKCTGTKFIGDSVSHFDAGDLTFIGSDIPHLFRNEKEYYLKAAKKRVEIIYIHFTRNFLGDLFFEVPEMKSVKKFLERPALAMNIDGGTREYVSLQLHKMSKQSPKQRLLTLLAILMNISASKDLKPLLSDGFVANNNGDSDKINFALEYIANKYTEEIYIQEVASKLNMSVASFSRYFRNYTRKTFSAYVTEIRIRHACKLLMENNYRISEICYMSGFENLSNFYRHFKRVMCTNPKDYRDNFLSNVL